MCGIIAVVRRAPTRPTPTSAEVEAQLSAVTGVSPALEDETSIVELADRLEALNLLLGGLPGVSALLADANLRPRVAAAMEQVEAVIADYETALDQASFDSSTVEQLNSHLLRAKDAAWAVGRDRIRTATAVADFSHAADGPAAIAVFTSVQTALSALDRLEVRGRDSAGLHLLVTGHGLDLTAPAIAALLEDRSTDPLFGSGSVREADGMLSFVYKAAAEIGELGDNTAALRAAITNDELLHAALRAPTAGAVVLGHTRWASVGIISEANAHPLNSEMTDQACPYATAVLNGDVDNFADIKALEDLSIASGITTDAKVIPTLLGKHLAAGVEADEAFRRTVAALDGSVAIAAHSAPTPQRLHLALRGSGQALYVGLAEDSYIVASEPYGVVEETNAYLRMDGETPGNPENAASRGQVIALDGAAAGTLDGIHRLAYDGTELPVDASSLVTAEITTRDIDRGQYEHYLLKEITEAPGSFRKTLRGKLVGRDGHLHVELGDETLSAELRSRIADATVNRVQVIGQGTAAVAGEAVAHAFRRAVRGQMRVEALPATELSGFHLRSDMSDTLVVAISQSGTTTDTNRTVDLVRARGASVIAIVNRRGSDLTDKADGVLYTSDGRDVEMSVASTKAFYSQVAAGFLLAAAVAERLPVGDEADAPGTSQDLLQGLRDLPTAMERVLELRSSIGSVAAEFAPRRRYWALVGNGANKVAAREIRIKLSELCYKSIAADSTEDKKHIDLSAEPLILVCAAGLSGSTAADVAKEVAIYRAHKAAPIVVADEGASFPAALAVVSVPAVHPELGFVLSTMVGHLFGYEAALAIDAQADPLRRTRATLEQLVATNPNMVGDEVLRRLRPILDTDARKFLDGVRNGDYNGHMEASTAVRIASMYRYALGITPMDSYQLDHGKVGTPATVLEDLETALTLAIEELTRPIDAIKHQAKTVTVGISRSEEGLLEVPIVKAVLDAGAGRDRLSYKTLQTLAAIDPGIDAVTGWIRYSIDGDAEGDARLAIVDRGGVARDLPSRVDRDPVLKGSKHLVATDQRVLVTRGRRDDRTVVIVPEIKDKQTVGITLFHVQLHKTVPAAVARSVLDGYRNRYATLHDYVLETEPTFREDLLGELPLLDLLTRPIVNLADEWRQSA